jgi:hypothetical protein
LELFISLFFGVSIICFWGFFVDSCFVFFGASFGASLAGSSMIIFGVSLGFSYGLSFGVSLLFSLGVSLTFSFGVSLTFS